MLRVLLAHPGEVVTREALRAALWPDDTFVDFDAGLNIVINKIRHVLGDSASSPRFVETLPRRGYRFIAPVSAQGDVDLAPDPPPALVRAPVQHRWLVAAGIMGALATVGVWVLAWRPSIEVPPMRVVPVAVLAGDEMMPTLSPDGEQVAFVWNGDQETENLDVYVTIPGSSTVRRLTSDTALDVNPSWSPDGRQIAFVRYRPTDRAGTLYAITPLGGADRKLSDFGITISDNPLAGPFGQISWSPDGRYIAAARASFVGQQGDPTGIYVIPIEGGEPRRLTKTTAPAVDRDPAFSPDG